MLDPRPVHLRPAGRSAVTGLAIALGLTAALAGCGSSGSSTASTSEMPGMSMSSHASGGSSGMPGMKGMKDMKGMIMIEDYAFSTPKSVAAGSRVLVMNQDAETHTVTADSGHAFDVTAPPGRTVSFTAPSRPGNYPYHCAYHSTMHGVLHVR